MLAQWCIIQAAIVARYLLSAVTKFRSFSEVAADKCPAITGGRQSSRIPPARTPLAPISSDRLASLRRLIKHGLLNIESQFQTNDHSSFNILVWKFEFPCLADRHKTLISTHGFTVCNFKFPSQWMRKRLLW